MRVFLSLISIFGNRGRRWLGLTTLFWYEAGSGRLVGLGVGEVGDGVPLDEDLFLSALYEQVPGVVHTEVHRAPLPTQALLGRLTNRVNRKLVNKYWRWFQEKRSMEQGKLHYMLERWTSVTWYQTKRMTSIRNRFHNTIRNTDTHRLFNASFLIEVRKMWLSKPTGQMG